jgi:acetyl-CoA carboxylase biotin carboxylase subunit
MGEAAVAAAKAVGYRGAGTCEFLVDAKNEFYFLEMNTRVQVEHAITEAVTGVDIVKTMIQTAAGEPLPFKQEDLAIRGHAFEARIYAEDPDKNFVPSPGEITVYRPPDGIGVRVDGGVYQGATVTVNYDPMVAKLVVWGATREESVHRLRRALQEFVVKGIKTSIPFHLKVLRHPKFVEGDYDTGFIDDHMAGGKGTLEPPGDERQTALVLAAIAAFRRDKARAERVSGPGGDQAGANTNAWKAFGRRRQMGGRLN